MEGGFQPKPNLVNQELLRRAKLDRLARDQLFNSPLRCYLYTFEDIDLLNWYREEGWKLNIVYTKYLLNSFISVPRFYAEKELLKIEAYAMIKQRPSACFIKLLDETRKETEEWLFHLSSGPDETGKEVQFYPSFNLATWPKGKSASSSGLPRCLPF